MSLPTKLSVRQANLPTADLALKHNFLRVYNFTRNRSEGEIMLLNNVSNMLNIIVLGISEAKQIYATKISIKYENIK